jgi:hypothetical protein
MYAFWTPFPPARTGTADYALALVGLLSGRFRISVIVADEVFDQATEDAAAAVGARAFPASAYSSIASQVELDVYFLANNPHHVYAMRRAEERRGLLVLHENTLGYAYSELAKAECRSEPGRWEERYIVDIRSMYPDHELALGAYSLRMAPYLVSMTDRVLARCRGVVVHSPVLAKRLALETGVKAHFVPHPPLAKVSDAEKERAWADLAPRLPERAILFGSLGFASAYKRLPVLVEAYRAFVSRNPAAASRTALVFAGQQDDATRHALAELKGRLDLAPGQWTSLPYLSEPELQVLLERLDLVVNLRYPSCGEASGILTRALEAGKPTLVSDHAYSGSFPEDIVVKIPVTDKEMQSLVETFERCAEGDPVIDPARVKAFAAANFSQNAVAGSFGACLERYREPTSPSV